MCGASHFYLRGSWLGSGCGAASGADAGRSFFMAGSKCADTVEVWTT